MLVPQMGICNVIVSTPEGFISIVHSCGKFMTIWEPGCHIRNPWTEIAYMVSKQYITYDTPVNECPTIDNVMVEIDVSVVFHIKESHDDIKAFVYSLGPEKLDDMLQAFQQECVRTMARQKKYSNIYDLMDTEEYIIPEAGADEANAGEIASEKVMLPGQTAADIQMTPIQKSQEEKDNHAVNEQLEYTKQAMNEKLDPYGVQIYSITITNVKLPSEFRYQMETATTFDSKNRCASAEQEYKLLVIKNNEKQHQARQRADENLKEMASTNQMRLAQEEKLTTTFQAETNAIIANIKEEMNSELRQIGADADLGVAKLETQKEVLTSEINATTSAMAFQLNAEIDAFVKTTRAECSKTVSALEAKALSSRAEAESISATALVSKRDFEAKMAQLRILKNLAVNENVAVSGSNKDSVVAQIVASQNASIALGITSN